MEPGVGDGGHGTDGHPHGADRLCEAGDRVYSRAVRRGRVPREDAETVPCLVELALLHPDPDDMGWLVPTSPQTRRAPNLSRRCRQGYVLVRP